ncbi:hypothetical protein RJT34_20438 [Clitoria ternatea]|uniref:Uncharacterized protein n=1 Tax=Clitoria ternatea TaxID=43366 RepID=A0AAN9ISU0_CLITE
MGQRSNAAPSVVARSRTPGRGESRVRWTTRGRAHTRQEAQETKSKHHREYCMGAWMPNAALKRACTEEPWTKRYEGHQKHQRGARPS